MLPSSTDPIVAKPAWDTADTVGDPYRDSFICELACVPLRCRFGHSILRPLTGF